MINATATWTNATAQNTTLVLTGQETGAVLVSLVISGTVTVGQVSFEASDDGVNWYAVTGIVQGTFSIFTNWQPSFGSPVAFQFNIAGFSQFRLRLATALIGTGNVTASVSFVTVPYIVLTSVVQQNGANLHQVTDYTSPTALVAGAYAPKFINASGTGVNLKASSGNLYGLSLTNETAVAAYLEFFNTAGAPTLGTTAVVFAIKIPASSNVTIPPGEIALMNFTTGIAFACVTTENGSTTNSVTGMIWFQ